MLPLPYKNTAYLVIIAKTLVSWTTLDLQQLGKD